MKKRLYVVKDVPRYIEDASNYCYVVMAESYKVSTGKGWLQD